MHEQPSRTTTKWTDERKHRGSELPSALQPVFTAIVPAVSSSGRAVNAKRPRGKKPGAPLEQLGQDEGPRLCDDGPDFAAAVRPGIVALTMVNRK